MGWGHYDGSDGKAVRQWEGGERSSGAFPAIQDVIRGGGANLSE
jgi:hypothetical protein